jgi:long-chain acyl-CoA synthetase
MESNIFTYIERYAKEMEAKSAFICRDYSVTFKELLKLIYINRKAIANKFSQHKYVIILRVKDPISFIIIYLTLFSLERPFLVVSNDLTEFEISEIKISLKNSIILEDDEVIRDHSLSNDSELGKKELKPDPEKAYMLQLSSGSTGRPKFCIRTLRNLFFEGLSYIKTLNITSDDMIYTVPPLQHSYAMGAGLIPGLIAGATNIIEKRFIPRTVLNYIHKYKPSILILVPIMAKSLYKTYSKRVFDLSSLRVVIVGAGKITKEIFENFYNKFGIMLSANYGSSETGGVISRLNNKLFTSIGNPMYGVKIKICDDNENSVPTGQIGELYIKTPAMTPKYYNEKNHNITKDFFYKTSDMVIRDVDGNVFFQYRKKNIINIGGKKVNPVEIENVIQRLNAVTECLVLKYNKTEESEGIRAIIVGDKKLTTSQILQHCKKYLSDYKIPGMIEFREFIPKNDIGKIIFDKL